MKQQSLEAHYDDSGDGHEDLSDSAKGGGLHRMLSPRMVSGDGDRKTLLKSSDSKRSLLARGLSQSMKKLKNTVKQKDGEEEAEEVVPLMEYEMLKARLHVAEGTAMQQKEEIEHFQQLLSEKDDIIDNLMQRLEAMSIANSMMAGNASQRNRGPPKQSQKLKRVSSLEEKRLKKRQMERVHALGLSRGPGVLNQGLQSLESVNLEEAQDEIGTPSVTSADPQPNKEPISGSMVRVDSKVSLSDLMESNQDGSSSPKSPGGRKKLSLRRGNRRKEYLENLHNSGLTAFSEDSYDLMNIPGQPERKIATSSAALEDTSASPKTPSNNRRGLGKQSSKRNLRRKKAVETGGASPNDDSDHLKASSPRHAGKNVLTSVSGAADESKEHPSNRSKSPHRRHDMKRQGSRRSGFRRKNSMESLHNSVTTISTEDSQVSGYSQGSASRRSERQVHMSSSIEETNESRTPSKAPLRRPIPKQSSKRKLNSKNSSNNTADQPGKDPSVSVPTKEQQDTTQDTTSTNAPHNRRQKNTVRQANRGGPSRRSSGESGSFRNRAQARSAKTREVMKTSESGTIDDSNMDSEGLPFASPRASSLRSRPTNNGTSSSSSSQRGNPLPKVLIFPASMEKNFKEQDMHNGGGGREEKPAEAESETDGFLVNFGEPPFNNKTMGATNGDDQLNWETGHKGIDKAVANQDSSQDAHHGANDNYEEQKQDSNHDHSDSNADPSMMPPFCMDGIAKTDEKNAHDSSMPNGQQKSIMDTDSNPTNVGAVSTETEPSDERPTKGSSNKPELAAHSGKDWVPATSEGFASPGGAQGEKEKKKSRGREYLLQMNRNETLGTVGTLGTLGEVPGETYSKSSSRSRSLSPGWTSPKTPSGRRKLSRIKKGSTNKEANLDKDSLKARFKKSVRQIVKLNDQFQQTALPSLQAEKKVDIRSISSSFSNLDVIDPVVDESKIYEIQVPPVAESEPGVNMLPPPPQMSAMSPPLNPDRPKRIKTVHWELEQNLFRLVVIPVYDQQQKKDCFYKEEDIKKFRFDLFMEQHAADVDIDSLEDEMMADDILDDMSFADEIVSDEDIHIDIGIMSRRGSL